MANIGELKSKRQLNAAKISKENIPFPRSQLTLSWIGTVKMMTTLEFLTRYNPENIGSEDEVRSKFIIPLFQTLSFGDDLRGENYPIHYNEGRSQRTPKKADIVYFDDNDHINQRTDQKWIRDHSLVVIEAKNLGEPLNNVGQPMFYAMWARAPYYVLTNGEAFRVFQFKAFLEDEVVIDCQTVDELKQNVPELKRILGPNVIKSFCLETGIKTFTVTETNYQAYLEYMAINLTMDLGFFLVRNISKTDELFTTVSSYIEKDNVEKATANQIVSKEKSFAILGEPGAGKTWFTYQLALEQIKLVNIETSIRIPIIIEAKYLGNIYQSFLDAIESKLKWHVSGLDKDVIKDDIIKGRFFLVIDGLDEIRTDRAAIIGQILEIVKETTTIVMVTSRIQQYHYEFDSHLSVCKINSLDVNQIQDYLDHYINNGSYLYHQMSPYLRDLVVRPLFLKMTMESILAEPNKRIPKNISNLFSSYSEMLLSKWEKSKGHEDSIQIDISLLRTIVIEYASTVFLHGPNIRGFDDIILSNSGIDDPRKVREELLRCMLFIDSDSGPDIFHRAFLEYFYAEYLLKMKKETLIDYIENNSKDKQHYEVFKYLSGLLINKETQNSVLDSLEELNLELYWQCLNVRFSNEQDANVHFSTAEYYLYQLRSSYVRILANHFKAFVPAIQPWSALSQGAKDLENVSIEGSLDRSQSSLSFRLFIPEKPNDYSQIIVKGSQSKPKLTRIDSNGQHGEPVSISSMTTPDMHGRRHYYHLHFSNLGLDSAREISLKEIKTQIFEVLEERIPLVKESYPMIIENIEGVFSQLRYERLPIPSELRRLSLVDNLEETLNLLEHYKDTTSFEHQGQLLQIDFPGIYRIIKELGSEDKIKENLLPLEDIDFKSLGKSSYYTWELYSKEQLEKYFIHLFNWFQDGYRMLVEKLFPTLKDQMSLYQCGPIRYSVIVILNKQVPFHSGTHTTWEPVPDNEDKCTVVSFLEERENQREFRLEYSELQAKLKSLGRNVERLTLDNNSHLMVHFEEGILRNKIYNQIIHDLKQIIGDKY